MAIETSNDDKERTLTKILGNLNTDMQTISETYMIKNEYKNACSAYDSVVEKYNIDMGKASKDMLTVKELKKDGGKNGGSCSIADASIKMMGIIEKMQKLMNNADIAMEEFEEFSTKHDKILPLMSTNPSKYCDELDNITKTYIKE
jgi:Xaa-Pro aminopeptidase